ncbi:MerR family transcriptional regulator [Microbacterium sp.]|uniref:helix-turn-helix domain-containing protein n=1 Tax=Microbacterium sp. TaxID=51671 RepID=UPI003C70D0FB
MAWSTRELAELADTTVNTIRHYHRLGLLEEPTRRYNGYKQYGVKDLVRLLRIRRLVGLGVPLSQIGEVDADGHSSQEMLRELDAELVASIDRLQRARADIAAILRDDAPADAPAGFESVAASLSESDRSILHISGQLYDEQAMADLRSMVEVDVGAGDVGRQIDALPADADEATRDRLARLLAPTLAQNLIQYPWLLNPAGRLSKSERVTRQTITEAVVELYNPAQLDVLGRASLLAQQQLQAGPGAPLRKLT